MFILFWSHFYFPAETHEMKWKMGVMRGQASAVEAHCSPAVRLGQCRQTHSYTHSPGFSDLPAEQKK